MALAPMKMERMERNQPSDVVTAVAQFAGHMAMCCVSRSNTPDASLCEFYFWYYNLIYLCSLLQTMSSATRHMHDALNIMHVTRRSVTIIVAGLVMREC
jgi:hypothetical protein